MSFSWNTYRGELNVDPDSSWEDAADLSRLSLSAALAERSPTRRDLSAGSLRLSGDGVVGHAAHLDEVADALRHFQRLVLATGMALSGHKSLRGNAPAELVSKTRLNLSASPLPGSLVLQFVPEMLPSAEIMPDGQADFLHDGETQLVDTAVGASIELLNLSKSAGADADESAFIRTLKDSGPRVATTLRDFAKSLADANFVTEVAWSQPRRKRVGTRMTPPELTNLGLLIAARALEKEPVVLSGILRTVSDISPFKIELADGEIETIDVRKIPDSEIKSLSVGMSVRITAAVTEEVAPGSEVKTRYSATQIAILNVDGAP